MMARAARLGHRPAVRRLTPAPSARLQRVAVTTAEVARKAFGSWSRRNLPRDGESVHHYVGRFETWLVENDHTITEGMVTYLRDNVEMASSEAVGLSFTAWTVSNPPSDGDTIEDRVAAFQSALRKEGRLLTAEAKERLDDTPLSLLKSIAVDLEFRSWVVAGGAHDGDTVPGLLGAFRSQQLRDHQRLLTTEASEQLSGRPLSLIKTARVKTSFSGWAGRYPPSDSDDKAAYLDRYVAARLGSDRVVTAEARGVLDESHYAVPSSNVEAALKVYADDHRLGDGDDAEVLRTGYLQSLRNQDPCLVLTAEAKQTLANLTLQVIASGELLDLWKEWNKVRPRLEDEEFLAYVGRFRTQLRDWLGWLTVEALDRLVGLQVGDEAVAAMGLANVRTGEAHMDPFQYPDVWMLNPKTAGWEIHREGFLNPDYWEPVDPLLGHLRPPYWNFRLRSGTKPSAAVNAAFAGPTRLECLSTIDAVLARAVLEIMGADRFDQEFAWRSKKDPGVVIGTNRYRELGITNRVRSFIEAPVVHREEDLVRGDWIYFKNDVRYLRKHPTGLWQGENLIYEGEGLYSGFGLSGMTTDRLRLEMERAFNEDPTTADRQDSGYDSSLAHSKDANVVGLQLDTVKRFRFRMLRETLGL